MRIIISVGRTESSTNFSHKHYDPQHSFNWIGATPRSNNSCWNTQEILQKHTFGSGENLSWSISKHKNQNLPFSRNKPNLSENHQFNLINTSLWMNGPYSHGLSLTVSLIIKVRLHAKIGIDPTFLMNSHQSQAK